MSDSETEITVPRSFESPIGDAKFTNLNLYCKSFDDPVNIPTYANEFKISYPPTMESQIRKLRLSMETWREVILKANEVLLWKHQWHPTAMIGGCTVVFMLLWLLEPNILTVVSLVGLFITIADYILPTLVSSLFKTEVWTSEKQSQYEEICTNIILHKTKLELLISSYYRMKVTNSKLYFTLTIFGLSFLAWIGATINNLFLMYVLCVFMLLLPGMSHHGMLNKGSETLSKMFTDLIENAKSKVGQKKDQ
ncbi:hypothetical protein NQ315_014342 [Exocentrus adspersus]|uniref:RETREG1-3/ARL6IP-like N-terminal reticulon-homology domain-containing protein n=1 Tax=Exocentrus adspersus TaxID=1586481 RepID=A0AAV8VLH2_9CUCU|nr:hypothetical protein NQ315_014342 [Exocentrus adspersus]